MNGHTSYLYEHLRNIEPIHYLKINEVITFYIRRNESTSTEALKKTKKTRTPISNLKLNSDELRNQCFSNKLNHRLIRYLRLEHLVPHRRVNDREQTS